MEENVTGVTCVAAPIFDNTGRVIAAFSISGPANRMNAKLNAMKVDVRAAASTITKMLAPPGGVDAPLGTNHQEDIFAS
jgi:DNA-binding IclR family transcriptional regulator